MTAKKTVTPVSAVPVARVSRVVFKLGATIPTGNYENLAPSIEVEYTIPEGAAAPNFFDEMELLRHNLATSLMPTTTDQTNAIPLLVKQVDGPESINAIYMKSSPLFRWLSAFDSTASDLIVAGRYEKFLTAMDNARKQVAAAMPDDTEGPR